ncbi:MAG: extracellular solute-binding protein [Anaerohalosphaeraceae bacterium]
MKRLYNSVWIGVLCAAAGLVGCAKKTPTQESVVVYVSVDQQVSEPILAEFEKQTGVKVLARYDTEASKTVGLVQRLRSEAANPGADVFWSGEIFHTIHLAREGLLQPYQNTTTQDWPRLFRDEKRLWYGFSLRGRVIAYNTTKVSPEKAPRTLEDILKPEWRGRVVMARPQFGTTGGDVASWFVHYGQDKAKAILAGLKANDIRLADGNSSAVRMVATGQADVCFTDTDDVYAGQRNGWPIAMNPLDQAGDGSLVIPNTAGIVKGCPNPIAAAKLMEFLLSEQQERLQAQSDSHNYPVHMELHAEFDAYAIIWPLEVNYQKVADALPEAIRIAGEIFKD